MQQLMEELSQIQLFARLNPAPGDKGPPHTESVLLKQTLPQHSLAQSSGLNEPCITLRG
jgi:hypothetical protein